jgi:hypothetical protein
MVRKEPTQAIGQLRCERLAFVVTRAAGRLGDGRADRGDQVCGDTERGGIHRKRGSDGGHECPCAQRKSEKGVAYDLGGEQSTVGSFEHLRGNDCRQERLGGHVEDDLADPDERDDRDEYPDAHLTGRGEHRDKREQDASCDVGAHHQHFAVEAIDHNTQWK